MTDVDTNSGTGTRRSWPAPSERVLAASAVVLASVPILWHGVRAAAGSWVPTGDDAYFTLRSLDVGTSHHPLLGAWSSGSVDVERMVNNLGPLQLDLLAPFTKVAWAGGTALGVIAVHLGAVAAIAWLSHRLGGHRQVIASMVGVAVLAWTMGSEMLVTPRQHQFLLPTYLCVLVATWASARGDRWGPLVWVAAASLAVQTHLSYPILVLGLAAAVVAGQVDAWRTRPSDRPALRSAWLTAGVVGLVLWSQTIVDQVAGWGNLTAVLASGGEAAAPSATTGARIVATVLVTPDGYLRPGFATFDPNNELGSDLQLGLLAAMWSVLVAGTIVALRARRRTAAAGFATATFAVTAAVVDAAQLPVTQFGLTAANYRWLWPTAAFLVIGAASAVARARREAAVLAAVAVAALAVLNLPRSYQVDRPEHYRAGQEAVATITDQLARELPERGLTGPVVIDQREMYFGHPFAYPLAVVVRELGLEYRLEGAGQARRFGESRVATGDEAVRLVLHHGEAAAARFDDPDTVAYAAGPSPVAVSLVRSASP